MSLQHQFNDEIMGYVMGSTGYKGLAYDITSGLTAATAAQQPVKAETAKSLEVGVKGNFFNDRFTVNAALFDTRFDNFQQNSGSYLPGTTTFVTRLNSVPSVSTKGFEVDASALVASDFVINGGFAYTKARIDDFKNGPCYNVAGSPNAGFNAACTPKDPNFGGPVQDLSGAPLPNAPKYKVSLGGQYDVRLPSQSFNAFINGSVRAQSHVVTNLNQDPSLSVAGYGVANLGLGIKDKGGKYKLSVFANNIFNQHYANTGFTGAGSWSAKAPNPVVTVTNTTWTPARDAFRYYGVRFDLDFH